MAWSFDDELIHKTLVVGKNKQKCVGAGNAATPGSFASSGVANFGAEGFGQAESTLMVETSEHQTGDRACTIKGNATIEGDAENVLIVDGDVYVTGKVDCDNKGRLASRFGTADSLGKIFDMVHPTKGKGHRLAHACIEGPEVAVYFRGRCRNKKEINLPEYWKGLVHTNSITVQLQPVGSHQDIIVKRWDDEKIYLQSNGGMPIDCFYHVYGERKDINPLHVEYEGETWEEYPDPNHRNFDPLDPERNLLDETYRGPRNTVTM